MMKGRRKKARALRQQAAPAASFDLQWWLSRLFCTKCPSACGETDLISSVRSGR